EALNNVIRHSGATEVQISLGFMADELIIKVEDNGHGLNMTETQGSGDGLKGMQERLRRLGGRCEITGVANGGTCVKLVIRVRLPEAL
ncbi:MAG: sensor histidine kinase, partial [Limisphaerales bacterium]